MTTPELEATIEMVQKDPSGRNKDISPYELKVKDGLRHFTRAHLYTPILRVKMVARAAQLSYKPFTAADVPQAVCQNLAFVSAWPYYDHSVRALVLLPIGSTDANAAIQPAWTEPFSVVAPAIFGAFWVRLGPVVVAQSFLVQAEEQTLGLVAAFPPDALTEGREIVIVYVGTFGYGSLQRQRNEFRIPILPEWK